MRRTISISFLVIILLAVLPLMACSLPVTLKLPAAVKQLWDIDLGLYGFTKAGAQYRSWWSYGAKLEIDIEEAAFANLEYLDNPTASTIKQNGITGHFTDSQIVGDLKGWVSIAGDYYHNLNFIFDSHSFTLTEQSSQKKASHYLSISTVHHLLSLDADARGRYLTLEYWSVGFNRGALSLNIVIYPGLYGLNEFQHKNVNFPEWSKSEEGNVTCYTRQDKFNNVFNKEVVSLAEFGLVDLSGHISTADGSQPPSVDSLAFINRDLLIKIIQWMESTGS
jgi:hypothetical protein